MLSAELVKNLLDGLVNKGYITSIDVIWKDDYQVERRFTYEHKELDELGKKETWAS